MTIQDVDLDSAIGACSEGKPTKAQAVRVYRELERLRAENELLAKDAERMNFIESHPDWLGKYKKWWRCVRPSTNYEYSTYNTAREAIDAAINGTNQ